MEAVGALYTKHEEGICQAKMPKLPKMKHSFSNTTAERFNGSCEERESAPISSPMVKRAVGLSNRFPSGGVCNIDDVGATLLLDGIFGVLEID